MYKNEDVLLRPVRENDASTILKWENDEQNWSVSETKTAYTLGEIIQLIENLNDLELAKQARYMIVDQRSFLALGTVDLYNMDFEQECAWVGVLIADLEMRKKGIASIALRQLEELCVEELGVYRLLAKVHEDNLASQKLFEHLGFQKKKDFYQADLENGDYLETLIFEKWLKK